MAQGDITLYNNGIEQILIGNIDFDADTFGVILVNSLYTFSADGNPGYTHVDSREITATGYTASGKNVTTVTVTQRDTVDNVQIDFSDITWTNLGSDIISGAIVFDETVASDLLVFYMEITTNSGGGDYTLQWGASGVIVASSA